MGEQASACLSALCPRVLAGHSTQLYESDATVRVYLSPVMSGDLVVQTIFSILAGPRPGQQLIEFCRVSPSRLWALLAGFPVTRDTVQVREFRVWTSPLTLARDLTRKRAR